MALKKLAKKTVIEATPVVEHTYTHAVSTEVTFRVTDSTPEELHSWDNNVMFIVDARYDEADGELYSLIPIEHKAAYVNNPAGVQAFEATLAEVHPYAPLRLTENRDLLDSPVVVIPELQSVIAASDNDLVQASLRLYTDINRNFFLLGGVLAKIKEERIYERDGKTWPDFVQSTYGYKHRKAEYYIAIYQAFSRLDGFDLERLASVGWSKAAELARFVTDDNVEDLLTTAESSSVLELKSTLETAYTDDGAVEAASSKIKKTTLTFKLFSDQGDLAVTILDEAQRYFNLTNHTEAFEALLIDWAGMRVRNENQESE